MSQEHFDDVDAEFAELLGVSGLLNLVKCVLGSGAVEDVCLL